MDTIKRLFNIKYPIVQGGMIWCSGWELAAAVSNAGGKIDEVYFCPDVDENSPYRKPNPGMGLKAKAQFPDINFSTSIMVGNTLSDMGFGRNLGCYTVFLATTRPEVSKDDNRIDLYLDSLHQFATILSSQA